MGKPRRKPVHEGGIAVEDPPETQPVPVPPTSNKRPAHRPKEADRTPIPTARNFFERLSDINRDDWGTRANIHLYRLEPFTDRLRSGTVTFIMKYAEPIDETRILMDHGSGRYRALLTFRKPSSEKGDELDRHDFDLLNIKFPPKIPKGEWVDDPRNKKWEWARNFYENGDKPTVVAPSQTESVVESFRVFKEIQQDLKPDTPAAAQQPSMLDTIRAVKEILPQPAAPTDNTLLNTVVTLLTTQITAQQAETAALRQELRQRDGSKFNVETIVESANKFLPLLERVFPSIKDGVVGAVTRTTRSNKTGWQEVLTDILPSVINSPVMTALGQGIAMAWNQPRGGPQPGLAPPSIQNPALPPPVTQPQQQQAPSVQQELIGFLDEIWRPMKNHLSMDAPGEEIGSEFAAWVYDGYSADPRYDQAVSAARMAGVPAIVGLYRQSPYWATLAPIEAKFTAFLDAMLKWTPPADNDDDEVIDLREGK